MLYLSVYRLRVLSACSPAIPGGGKLSVPTPTSAPSTTPSPRDRYGRALPVFAWLSFLAEVLIIATGGTVRLTGSGLGCTEWPLCTPESLIPTEAEGIHGAIEFGNRTMTGLVGLLALAVVLLVWRHRRERRDLFILSLVVLIGGVVPQAIIGAITVWTSLNPFIVGFHYTMSLILSCVTAAFLVRLYRPTERHESVVPRWFAIVSHVTGLALAVTIFFGVLTTASGPHSGDRDILRNGFDATVVAHVHSWPGYILAALVLTLTVASLVKRLAPAPWFVALTAVICVQVVVGVIQAREGLPPMLVGIHMVLAALSAACYTVAVMKLKRPVDVQEASSVAAD